MTREEAKELLPIIQAFAEGKTIQVKITDNRWYDWEDETCELNFNSGPQNYRIKLESTESEYIPFKNQEECWNEMLKHQPFGWVRTIISDNLYQIESISHEIFCNRAFTPYKEAFAWFKFADGTPFGIKEE